MPTTYTSIECPTCLARFEGIELEAGIAALEARPCADAACGALLCACCAKFACASENVYTDYIDLGIDPETGYHDEAAVFTCRACGVRGEAEELVYRPAFVALPARIAPGRETRRAAERSA